MKKHQVRKTSSIHKSSGNVFEDIGFPTPEAERLALLSMLAIEIEKYIKAHNLTQAEAARQFAVSQPRISNLLNGKFHLFSIDTLIEMLLRVGIQVKIGIKKAA
jgi:predicted XRE-type DNA-binding protein